MNTIARIDPKDIPAFAKTMITITVMLVTIIEILDMTIVNVALPPMMGELGANSDQITWVLTSYIVSSAIIMPLTGFLVTRFGRKKLLLTNILGFLAASMLCGLSTTLAQIVFFRVCQGVFGAALVPLSQYILSDIFERKDQGKAMAIWGIGVMVAPVLGPTLGGYITEVMNWRWVFYINLPVCLLTFFLALQFIKETPTEHQKIDWTGLSLMAIGIGCLQIFLDRGNTNDWFSSKLIVALCVVWVFALTIFVIRGLTNKDNIINLHLFKNRNFMAATVMLTIFGIALFGVVSILPIMLEHLMGYTAELAGLFMAPRAIASAVGMLFASMLMKKYDNRLIILIGIVLTAYGTYGMCFYDLHSSFMSMIWPTIIQGLGTGLFFVPLSTAALSTLSEEDAAEGAGLFNFGRNLGGSIGISLISTLITRESQINWNRMTSYVHAASYRFQHWKAAVHHVIATSPFVLQQVVTEVEKQSSMIAFIDAYWIVAWGLIMMLPLILVMQKDKENHS